MSKRKKSYRARLKDPKINTKIERKIDQISKANDAKNRQLLIRQSAFGTDNQMQQSAYYDFVQLPANTGVADSSNIGLDVVDLTAVGGDIYAGNVPVGKEVEQNVRYAKYFRFTKVQAFLQFFNSGDYPCKVRVSIVYIPNANPYTAASVDANGITSVLRPNQMICGIKDMRNKGIFKMNYINSRDDFTNIKHTILKSKQITLQPKIASSGSTVNGGAGGGSWGNTTINGGRRVKEVNLSVNFPGLGKRFVYNGGFLQDAVAHMSNGNMYLVISHNVKNNRPEPYVRGIGGAQYYIEKPSTAAWN